MEEPLHIILHSVEHSIADTVYLIPFLFATYLVMEWIEHKTSAKTQQAVRRAGVAGPLVGSVLGVVPQCGFSAMAATLYAGRVITLGTLMAVFLSTSDEMLPIFIAEQVPLPTIAAILGTKIAIGIVFGFAIDGVMRALKRGSEPLKIHELCRRDRCACNEECATCEAAPELVYEHHDDCAHGCDHSHHAHDHSHDSAHGAWPIVKSALKHTVQVTLFVLVVTFALTLVLEIVGEDALASFLSANEALGVLGASLIGLIPNCAASVAIAQLYVEGVLGSGAMLAGLLVSAGVGLLVLCRANRNWKQNALIIAILYAIGVACGLIANLIGVVF